MFSTLSKSCISSRFLFSNNAARFQTTTSTTKINPNILDLRVGLIKEIKRHENADSLYVSQIQISEEADEEVNNTPNIVQVCSGLVGLVPMDKLLGRRVVLVNNLKPSKMRGVKSEAMLLCADGGVPKGSVEDVKPKVEPVTPPEEAPVGSILEFLSLNDDEGASSADSNVAKKRIKSKIFANVAEDLSVDDQLRVVWQQKWVLCHNNVACCAKVLDADFVGAQVR